MEPCHKVLPIILTDTTFGFNNLLVNVGINAQIDKYFVFQCILTNAANYVLTNWSFL